MSPQTLVLVFAIFCGRRLLSADARAVLCGPAGKPWLGNFEDSATNDTKLILKNNLTAVSLVTLDGRSLSSPSTPGAWKIVEDTVHVLAVQNSPEVEFWNWRATTGGTGMVDLSTCAFPGGTPNFDDPSAAADYADDFEDDNECKFVSNLTTWAYMFGKNSCPHYTTNSSCLLFNPIQVSGALTIDMTAFTVDSLFLCPSNPFISNWTAYFQQINLDVVEKCKAFGDKCKSSAKCCLGYACIRRNDEDKKGTCQQCALAGDSCPKGDECCDGLKCGKNKGKCKVA